MNKLPKKYIPFICLLLMVLLSWVEESYIFEGKMNHYLYVEGHVIVRSILRSLSVLILFILGYIGLQAMSFKWLTNLWMIWYIVVIVTAGLRVLPLILFHQALPSNVWSFINSFYALALSPFPFMFLWLLAVLVKRQQQGGE